MLYIYNLYSSIHTANQSMYFFLFRTNLLYYSVCFKYIYIYYLSFFESVSQYQGFFGILYGLRMADIFHMLCVCCVICKVHLFDMESTIHSLLFKCFEFEVAFADNHVVATVNIRACISSAVFDVVLKPTFN